MGEPPILDPPRESALGVLLQSYLPGECEYCVVDARRLIDAAVHAARQDGRAGLLSDRCTDLGRMSGANWRCIRTAGHEGAHAADMGRAIATWDGVRTEEIAGG